MEETYVDILEKLKSAVQSDIISNDDMDRAVYHIDILEEILWKYSA